MAKNKNLNAAARNKNDEFYTQFSDIQREMNCYYLWDKNFLKDKTVLLPCDDPDWSNFTKFFALNLPLYKMKKLISTSYAADAKKINFHPQISLFEEEQPNFDIRKTNSHGKIFTLDMETRSRKPYAPDSLTFDYLEGDGDFRSAEVKKLRDEADVIITNPPLSLFREFLAWIMEADKKFLIIGNINCITYKEVFPLIMANKIWLGNGIGRWISGFIVPEDYELYGTETRIDEWGKRIVATNQCLWLTNLEHGKRHEPLRLMTLEQNFRYSKHKEIRGIGFKKYDNYDAIEVPFVDAIPDDYDGVMGVPITFLDKYCPEQFEILGHTSSSDLSPAVEALRTDPKNRNRGMINGQQKYDRLLIRRRR